MTKTTKIKDVYDRLYEAIKHYINNASKDTLAEHYDWYGVDVGDTEDLINTMYESYCGNYEEKELNKCIQEFDEITEEEIIKQIKDINEELKYCDERDKVCCTFGGDQQRYELEIKLQELEQRLRDL